VVGLNPSFGRFPIDGLPELFDSISHHAPLTRCVEDAALFLDVTQGTTTPTSSRCRTSTPSARSRDRSRASMCRSAPPSAAGRRACTRRRTRRRTRAQRRARRTHRRRRHPPQRGDMGPGVGGVHGRLLRSPRAEHHERIDPAVLALIEAGQSMGAVELKRLEIERSDLWGRMAPIFRTHDVLLCPTMAIGPVPPGSPSGRRWGSWMRPATTAPR